MRVLVCHAAHPGCSVKDLFLSSTLKFMPGKQEGYDPQMELQCLSLGRALAVSVCSCVFCSLQRRPATGAASRCCGTSAAAAS
jgi:hypothetical protein